MNRRFLTWFCFIMSLGILASCDNDDEKNTTQVELLSFGPSGVLHGEEITFIGNNLDKVTAIDFVSANVPASAFIEQTKERIVLVVPNTTEEGFVTLKSPQGDIQSKSIFSLEVPVTVESVTTDLVRAGDNITITGTYLNWVEGVRFSVNVEVSEFVSQSMNELVVKVPLEAQTGSIVILTGGTEPLEIESEEQVSIKLPSATDLSPSSIRHSDELTITGTDMDLIAGLRFPGGTTVTDFVSQTETQVVVKVPNNSQDGSMVLIAHSGLEVLTQAAISIILPKATDLSSDHNPGDVLVITGTDLDLVKEIIFPGGTSVSSFTTHTLTSIVVTIPETATAGSLKFRTIHDYIVSIELPFGDQLTLSFAIFDDELKGGWEKWGGWGSGSSDLTSAENIRQGLAAAKVVFAGDWGGAFQLGKGNTPTDGYSDFVFSIYGESGTDGLVVNLIVKGGAIEEKQITIQEGVWTDVVLPLSETFGDPTQITEITLQDRGWSGTLFIDHIGLR